MKRNHPRGWCLPFLLSPLLSLIGCGPEPEMGEDGTIQAGVVADLASGRVNAGTTLSLSTDASEATIYYTTDGSDPRTSETRKLYSSPIVVNGFTLRTYSTGPGQRDSDVSTRVYELDPASYVDIRRHGAVPNDRRDDSRAIQSAILEAQRSGKAVFIPSGTFDHAKALVFDGVDLIGTGPGSVLHAVLPDVQNVEVRGTGVTVSDLRLTSTTTKRESGNQHQRLYINRATRFVIERVTVDGSSAAGIFNFGGTHGVIRGNTVMNTRADGIHNTRAASHVLIEYNTVTATGDDLIAVVSYKHHAGEAVVPTNNITIRKNMVGRNTHGRGITVVGGTNILIEDNWINASEVAGIYVASEEQFYNTHMVREVTIRRNTVRGAGGTRNGHGALTVNSSHERVTGITFDSNEVYDSRHRGVLLMGNAVEDVRFMNNRVLHTGTDGIHIANGFRGTATFTGNLLEAPGTHGFFFGQPASARVRLTGNVFRSVNQSRQANVSVIFLGGGRLMELTIMSNKHEDAYRHPLKFFIEERATAAPQRISGNASPLRSYIDGRVVPTR